MRLSGLSGECHTGVLCVGSDGFRGDGVLIGWEGDGVGEVLIIKRYGQPNAVSISTNG